MKIKKERLIVNLERTTDGGDNGGGEIRARDLIYIVI